MAETTLRAVIKQRGRDQRGLTMIMAETIRRAVIKRRGRNRRGLTSQNELAYQLTKSSHCHCQVVRTTLACAKQSMDQRMSCDTERAGKKCNEKINKHKLILIAAAYLHKAHTTR